MTKSPLLIDSLQILRAADVAFGYGALSINWPCSLR